MHVYVIQSIIRKVFISTVNVAAFTVSSVITFIPYSIELPLSFLLNAVLSSHCPLFSWSAVESLGHSIYLKVLYFPRVFSILYIVGAHENACSV